MTARPRREGPLMCVKNWGTVRVQVAVLCEGDFFGEISLLTGATRIANVTALCRCDCIRIPQVGAVSAPEH